MSNVDWQSLSDKICVEMIEENKALKKENRELQEKINEMRIAAAKLEMKNEMIVHLIEEHNK